MNQKRFISFPIADSQQIKKQMLNWGSRFNICSLLDNNQYNLPYHEIECVMAVGCRHIFRPSSEDIFSDLKLFYKQHQDWLFGHLSYDLKNNIEGLSSKNPDRLGFPDISFFVPEYVIKLTKNELSIGSNGDDHTQIFHSIEVEECGNEKEIGFSAVIKQRLQKSQYLDIVKKIQQHILRGDCYELNFCQEFYAEGTRIDPVSAYNNLIRISPNPFAAFYKLDQLYLLCASPERYLQKKGELLISQPIKGTLKRELNSSTETDLHNKQKLGENPKDRSENVMIVDLVRNDISKVAEQGSVTVQELFGVYTFPQVYQMVSTISGRLQTDKDWIDAITASFPMGSMTGAPKRSAMELIDKYEDFRRGIFSGSIGYITPDGDFDFNVVIRSLAYNESNGYLSFPAGSAITFYSDPENEYEECLVKAKAIADMLQKKKAENM